jgi:phosphoglycolate phosphatase-like HAD superfamily hydrolase
VKWLALDFDGVVSDSAPECFVVALRAYWALRGDSHRVPEPASLFASGAPTLSEVRGATLYAPFVERMPLGNRAEDFGVVLASLEANRPLPDQASYDAFRAEQGEDWLAEFHRQFYRERDALSEADAEGWFELMGPYAALLPILHRHCADTQLAIATAKDGRAVAKLLTRYGLRSLFPPERVLDKETGVHKTAHLRTLSERFGVPFDTITFVDDKVNHLDRAAPLGVRCALAAWGYNGEREAVQAQERGYLVLSLDDFEARLFP